MEPYLAISILALGGLAGISFSWLYWQKRLRRLEEQGQDAEEGARRSLKEMMEKNRQLEEEIFAGNKREEKLQEEIKEAGRRLASLAEELQNSHRQFRELTEQIRESDRLRHESATELARIPGLEDKVAGQKAQLAQKEGEIAELISNRAALEQALAEEKRSLDECIIYVEGSHYLPGRVVRNLTGAKQP